MTYIYVVGSEHVKSIKFERNSRGVSGSRTKLKLIRLILRKPPGKEYFTKLRRQNSGTKCTRVLTPTFNSR